MAAVATAPMREGRQHDDERGGGAGRRCLAAARSPQVGGLPAVQVHRVVLATPRGFCAGVVRAIGMVEDALADYGAPVYVRRAIVHNPYVMARLEARGAIVVPEVDLVPEGAVVVFSAHGVARSVRDAAATRRLRVVDATCRLVLKVHSAVRRFLAAGYEVVLIGRPGHDEVNGTLGQATGGIYLAQTAADVARLPIKEPRRVAYATQTTLTPEDVAPVVAALRARFPHLVRQGADDVCSASRQRQAAVRRLAAATDLVLILGDATSSNSQRLREVAAAAGRPAYLIGSIADLRPEWLAGVATVGLAAGASTPEWLVREAADHFTACGASLGEVEARPEPRLSGDGAAAPETRCDAVACG